MVYGYSRCSTNDSKQDIERQIHDLKHLGVDFIFSEYESGSKEDRSELAKLLAAVKPKDTIVATEVSRLSRSTKQMCDILEFAKNNQLKLIIGGLEIDCSKNITAMQEGMLKMMSVFAEMESNLTKERIRSGISYAKEKGVRLGRPSLTIDKLPPQFKDNWESFSNGNINKTVFAKLCGVSRPTLDKYIRIFSN